MHSTQHTDDAIEIQLREAEELILEHDNSKDQRKKKKKTKRIENPSLPIDEDLHLLDETEDARENMEVDPTIFTTEEQDMGNHSLYTDFSLPPPIVNSGPSTAYTDTVLPSTVPNSNNLQHGRKGHDLDTLKKIWKTIHIMNESKESKSREQKILLTNASVTNFRRDWQSALDLQGYSFYDTETYTQKVYVNGSLQPLSTVLIDVKDEFYSLISMQVWKRVNAVTLLPIDATSEEIILFQSFFEKTKAAKVANFDLFTHRVSGDWYCTDQFIDLLVDTLPQFFFQFLKEMFPRDKDQNRQADLPSKILNIRLEINPGIACNDTMLFNPINTLLLSYGLRDLEGPQWERVRTHLIYNLVTPLDDYVWEGKHEWKVYGQRNLLGEVYPHHAPWSTLAHFSSTLKDPRFAACKTFKHFELEFTRELIKKQDVITAAIQQGLYYQLPKIIKKQADPSSNSSLKRDQRGEKRNENKPKQDISSSTTASSTPASTKAKEDHPNPPGKCSSCGNNVQWELNQGWTVVCVTEGNKSCAFAAANGKPAHPDLNKTPNWSSSAMGKAYASVLSKSNKPYRALMKDKRLARDASNKVVKPCSLVPNQVVYHEFESSTIENPLSLLQCTLSTLPTTTIVTTISDSSKPI